MKKVLWTLLYIGLTLFSVSAQADDITLRADDWCPYNCGPASDRPGFMVEIAQAIFQQAGHSVDYKIRPWSRAIKEAQMGTIHGIIGAVSSEVPDFVFPQQEQAESVMVFWVTAGTEWRYTDIDSLNGVRIAVIDQYSYGENLDTYVKTHRENEKIVVVSHGEEAFKQNLQLLRRGVVDAIAADRDVMSYHLYRLKEQDLFVDAGEIIAAPIYIAFSPAISASKNYADLLSQGMSQLRESGELKRILERYGLHDWKE